ncbi:unnamed protein product, partial [Polarella glacialis]
MGTTMSTTLHSGYEQISDGPGGIELADLEGCREAANCCGTGTPKDDAPEEVSPNFWETLKTVGEVARPFFVAGERFRQSACLLVLALAVCVILDTILMVKFSYVQRAYSTALEKKNSEQFYQGISSFVWLILVAVLITSLHQAVSGCLILEWRRYLTGSMMTKYLDDPGQLFYKLKISSSLDNPDQRVCQDTDSFTSTCVRLFDRLFGSLLSLISFSGVLFSISPTLFLFLVLYAAVGSLVAFHLFGVPLMRLQRAVRSQEASLRFTLVRVRENAESVAFYQGAQFESSRCASLLSHLLATYYQKLLISVGASGFNRVFTWVTWVLPPLVIAPAFFRGEVEFGVIAQTGFAFGSVLESLTFLISELDVISSLGAEAQRVRALQKAMAEASDAAAEAEVSARAVASQLSSGRSISGLSRAQRPALSLVEQQLEPESQGDPTSRSKLLEVDHLSLCAPARPGPSCGATDEAIRLRPPPFIIQDLSFTLRPGDALLLRGESGIGKSSLLRAIAGLWTRGQGLILRCPARACFFLPQQPYLCLGTLRQQALYPAREAAESAPAASRSRSPARGSVRSPAAQGARGQETPQGDMDEIASDAEISEMMHAVNLGHLLTRYGLDTPADFALALSLGEQQRLAFARLLLRRGVQLALLDEATSALDEENEARLYRLLQAKVPSFVSVGHRDSLNNFHSHALNLQRQVRSD